MDRRGRIAFSVFARLLILFFIKKVGQNKELFTAINNKIPAKCVNERGILFVIATCGDGFQLSMKTIMDRLGIKNKQNYYTARESLIKKGFLIYDEEANTLEINYDLLLDTTESNLMSHVEHDYNIKRI